MASYAYQDAFSLGVEPATTAGTTPSRSLPTTTPWMALGFWIGQPTRGMRMAKPDQEAAFPSVASCGFLALDAKLPAGGWLAGEVVEICTAGPGQAELQLLGPLLRQMLTQSRAVAFYGAPRNVDARSLASQALLAQQIEQVRSREPLGDSLCGPALEWLAAHPRGCLVLWQAEVTPTQWRKLTRAAQRSHAHVFLVRPALARWDETPAPVRLSLLPCRGGIWEARLQGMQAATAVAVRLTGQPLLPADTPPPPQSAHPLKIVRDPQDQRRTALCGTLADVCRELDRLVEQESVTQASA